MTDSKPSAQAHDDTLLLERYVRGREDDAFQTLVERYAPLVHGVCLRALGRSDWAEDATQDVFVLFARKAPRLLRHPSLAGWLYVAARNVARDLGRQERRRSDVERRAIPERTPPERLDVERLGLALDDELARLGPPERELIVLRFLHGESLAEVGERFGISEDAARMRVNRALGTLRGRLTQAGIAVPLERLTEALAKTPQAVPPSLARRLASGSVARPPSLPMISLAKPLFVVVLGVAALSATRIPKLTGRPSPDRDRASATTPVRRKPYPAPPFAASRAWAVPLRLEPKANGQQFWGVCVFDLPLHSGGIVVKVGGRSYALRMAADRSTIDVDRNGDGRFAAGETLALTKDRMKNKAGIWFDTAFAETTLRPPHGASLPIGFRRLPSAPPTIPEWADKLIVGTSFAYLGRATLGGKTMLVAVSSVGSGEDYLSLDRNGNGRAGDLLAEQYRLDEPFTLGGKTYQARLVFQGGRTSLEIAPSSARVPEIPLLPDPPLPAVPGGPDPEAEPGSETTDATPAEAVPISAKTKPISRPRPLLAAGAPAPDFRAVAPDGRSISLRALRGKVVVLEFWASWCGPCQASMPGLARIARRLKGQNAAVLGVDTWDDGAAFRKWVGANAAASPDVQFVRDPAEGDSEAIRRASIATRLYGTEAIPTTVVIDRRGKVVGTVVGAGNEAALVRLLRRAGLRG